MIFDRYSTSFRDSISGLYTEAYFAEVFQREWHRMLRDKTALSVVLIEPHLRIDSPHDQLSFKLIAEAVENATKRGTDIVCRFQSESIAIGLFNLDDRGTETVVSRVINAADDNLGQLIDNLDLTIAALNVLPTPKMTIEEVFEKAMSLLAAAGKKGKNSYLIDYYPSH